MTSSPVESSPDGAIHADTADWVTYFNNLEEAMHEFEVGLSQHNVAPLRSLPTPGGFPPEELRERSGELYTRITELEFRARVQREEMRAEFARLPRVRAAAAAQQGWGYGSALDISG
jgi:hypothetical protein